MPKNCNKRSSDAKRANGNLERKVYKKDDTWATLYKTGIRRGNKSVKADISSWTWNSDGRIKTVEAKISSSW